jgi:hypothetical protein
VAWHHRVVENMDAPAEIKKMMGPKETIEMYVDGESYPQITIDTMVITDERILVQRSNALGTTEFISYKFSEIAGVGVEKGFMRSIIRLKLNNGGAMASIRLPPKLDEQALELIKNRVLGRPSNQ